jgi:hypothetical protein
VHPGDGDRVFEAHQLGQHLRALDDGNLSGVSLDDLGIGLADRGAGHDHRGARHVPCLMAFIDRGAQLRQPVGHRAAAQI